MEDEYFACAVVSIFGWQLAERHDTRIYVIAFDEHELLLRSLWLYKYRLSLLSCKRGFTRRVYIGMRLSMFDCFALSFSYSYYSSYFYII
jgi:hypothetical protein